MTRQPPQGLRAEHHHVSWETAPINGGRTGSQSFADVGAALGHIRLIVEAGGRIVSFTRVRTMVSDLYATLPELLASNETAPTGTDPALAAAIDAYTATWQTYPGVLDAGNVDTVRSDAMTAALFAAARATVSQPSAQSTPSDLTAAARVFADQVEVLLSSDPDMPTAQQDYDDTELALEAFREALGTP